MIAFVLLPHARSICILQSLVIIWLAPARATLPMLSWLEGSILVEVDRLSENDTLITMDYSKREIQGERWIHTSYPRGYMLAWQGLLRWELGKIKTVALRGYPVTWYTPPDTKYLTRHFCWYDRRRVVLFKTPTQL